VKAFLNKLKKQLSTVFSVDITHKDLGTLFITFNIYLTILITQTYLSTLDHSPPTSHVGK